MWEYRVVELNVAEDKELNQFGKEGWELLQLMDSSIEGCSIAVFKRILPQQTAPSVADLMQALAEQRAVNQALRKELEKRDVVGRVGRAT